MENCCLEVAEFTTVQYLSAVNVTAACAMNLIFS